MAELNLNSFERQLLIDAYELRILKMKTEHEALGFSIKDYEARLQKLIQLEDDAGMVYHSDWPLYRKADFALYSANMVLTTRQIAEIIWRCDGRDPKKDVRSLIDSLGATLKQKVDKNQTFIRQEIGSEIYYGRIGWHDWLTDEPAEEYRFSAPAYDRLLLKQAGEKQVTSEINYPDS